MFQALGNTRPALISSASRLLTFALPALWLSQQPSFRIEAVWLLSMASVFAQAVTSLLLLRREFGLRLRPLERGVETPGPAAAAAR
jgi:Na+-driven multidrug efflux pump